MKNWRTTIVGALLALVSFLAIYQENGGDLGDWKQWVIPGSLAVLGFLAKDAANSLRLAVLACMLLPSCATNGAGQPTFLGLSKADWTLVGKEAAITGAKAAASSAFLSYGERRNNIEVTATK